VPHSPVGGGGGGRGHNSEDWTQWTDTLVLYILFKAFAFICEISQGITFLTILHMKFREFCKISSAISELLGETVAKVFKNDWLN
jgi:hypothetical protein